MSAAGTGPSPLAPVPSGLLILTVTRACNLRCSYCPTVKEGWPDLSPDDARRAVALFADRYGGGDVKLFGGEPLLAPEAVRAALDAARERPEVRWVYLSTNGVGLDADWLALLRAYPKGILTISMDGDPTDHRRLRRALPGVEDAYDRVVSLLPELSRTPRVVVTQTIAPATAERAAENFRHLVDLGFWRFNFLPGYYLPWRDEKIAALRQSFEAIAATVRERWARGERLYVRNLFTWAPTPFFNTGLVVDADRTIHPSNVGLSGQLDGLRGRTQVGTLDAPPTPAELASKAQEVNGLLEEVLPERIWRSTLAADAELTRFVRGLYPHWIAYKRRAA